MIFAILYALGILVTWPFTAKAIYEEDDEGRDFATFAGFFIAFFWPGVIVHLLFRKFVYKD
ncbi:hypothetical protein PBI_PEREGRIN_253 [Rhodococcus phage Peregrin]|nr:hypothetical protein PBI_PEREGRIN_253 [Rhodococcus phage Peregrin]